MRHGYWYGAEGNKKCQGVTRQNLFLIPCSKYNVSFICKIQHLRRFPNYQAQPQKINT